MKGENCGGEDRRIWQKLTEMAKDGDCRAMKLYYELLEKKNKSEQSHTQDMMYLAEIRRAVFGDDIVLSDTTRADADTATHDGNENEQYGGVFCGIGDGSTAEMSRVRDEEGESEAD